MTTNSKDWLRTKENLIACTLCREELPCTPRPIFKIDPAAKILIISQAPGYKAHDSGIPWHDPSGKRLIEWLGVSEKTFYGSHAFATMPMGMCYPGRGKSGDLPPTKTCAPHWHRQLLSHMPNVKLKLLIGQYSQKCYLQKHKGSLTENVRCWQQFLPEYFVLPHPSPRNQIWIKKNLWFEEGVLPDLKRRVQDALDT